MEDEARELVDTLELTAHPEGGYYRRTYESPVEVPSRSLPEGYVSSRRLGSAILYLLPAGQVSRLHRLRGDEMWHFYRGTPLVLHVFGEADGYRRVRLGKDPLDEETPQELVRGGNWFGATVEDGYALVGCTVSPEFQFEDFELAERGSMIETFPEQESLIRKLTEE